MATVSVRSKKDAAHTRTARPLHPQTPVRVWPARWGSERKGKVLGLESPSYRNTQASRVRKCPGAAAGMPPPTEALQHTRTRGLPSAARHQTPNTEHRTPNTEHQTTNYEHRTDAFPCATSRLHVRQSACKVTRQRCTTGLGLKPWWPHSCPFVVQIPPLAIIRENPCQSVAKKKALALHLSSRLHV